MELSHAIRNRHSYRGEFIDAPVSRDMLHQIVQSGIDAPSGKNLQTTSFVIVDEPSRVRETLSCIGAGKHLRSAQAAIVVVMAPDDSDEESHFFGVQDYSAAIQNMLLTITDLGLATVWIEGQLMTGAATQIARITNVAAPLEVRGVLPIGVPAEPVRPNDKRPFDERAWFNSYGAPDS